MEKEYIITGGEYEPSAAGEFHKPAPEYPDLPQEHPSTGKAEESNASPRRKKRHRSVAQQATAFAVSTAAVVVLTATAVKPAPWMPETLREETFPSEWSWEISEADPPVEWSEEPWEENLPDNTEDLTLHRGETVTVSSLYLEEFEVVADYWYTYPEYRDTVDGVEILRLDAPGEATGEIRQLADGSWFTQTNTKPNAPGHGSTTLHITMDFNAEGIPTHRYQMRYHSNGQPSESKDSTYDENGNEAEYLDTVYDSDGSVWCYAQVSLFYDADGHCTQIRHLQCGADWKPVWEELSTRDAQGNKVESYMKHFGYDGQVEQETTTHYGENAILQESHTIFYGMDGSVSQERTDLHDENGELLQTHSIIYYANGGVQSDSVITYEDGGKIERHNTTTYRPDGSLESQSEDRFNSETGEWISG